MKADISNPIWESLRGLGFVLSVRNPHIFCLRYLHSLLGVVPQIFRCVPTTLNPPINVDQYLPEIDSLGSDAVVGTAAAIVGTSVAVVGTAAAIDRPPSVHALHRFSPFSFASWFLLKWLRGRATWQPEHWTPELVTEGPAEESLAWS